MEIIRVTTEQTRIQVIKTGRNTNDKAFGAAAAVAISRSLSEQKDAPHSVICFATRQSDDVVRAIAVSKFRQEQLGSSF
ncbi:hypothetical protein KKC08_04890 [Patescibacteria group bacterium]|nr:hypothetical protein [Patescibacteria group bacterium]MCG2701725.1 hypothetical protein [Candidatus Parcubacteria bacterium]MBU4264630.1 hypothetical protein [Patescibacteria group bacterium]MBU4390585.1 hypothetical protein [Patescibacteria group bacterium]MBU4397473.1 hypothetical protein [Patescibacteria group bacterium]